MAMSLDSTLPDDAETLKALLIAARASEARTQEALATARIEAEKSAAEAARAVADRTGLEALIAHLKFVIEKLRRELYGSRSERGAKLLDQLELELEEMEASAREDELAAERAAKSAGTTFVSAHARRHPSRKPFPEHLPRERVIVPGPSSCSCCGSARLSKIGEDITETLEVIPRQWKVIQYVREKFTCRDCEKISQPPAPFHVISRGHVGPNLLAMVLHDKFTLHQPLNRQSEQFAREGIDLSLSTLADHVGSAATLLTPIAGMIRAHVFRGERIHGDDTPVPLLAKGKTVKARLWVYVRDDEPFGGKDPPAAVYYFSRDRAGEHPERHLAHYGGILQADAYAGFNGLYEPGREPATITEAACWAHGRRKFFVLADITSRARNNKPVVVSPIALEAVKRIDAIFDHERAINGQSVELRLAYRREHIAPLVIELEAWMRAERARLSRHADPAKAIDYMLKRWQAFTRFLDDGRICLTNNAAERALRGVALGRKAWLFAGSERGGERAALMYTLLQTAKLNNIDPNAWLADVLARINDHPINRIDDLLPWNWRTASVKLAA
jgi:transposase